MPEANDKAWKEVKLTGECDKRYRVRFYKMIDEYGQIWAKKVTPGEDIAIYRLNKWRDT